MARTGRQAGADVSDARQEISRIGMSLNNPLLVNIWPLVGGDRRDLSDPRRAGAQTARVFAAARHIHGLRGNGHFEVL
jgi:hypothetical protein